MSAVRLIPEQLGNYITITSILQSPYRACRHRLTPRSLGISQASLLSDPFAGVYA